MTKDAELQLLDQMIAQFGPNSYLGPWLADSRVQIEADIRSDFPMWAPMPGVARKEAAEILKSARADADTILQLAKTMADDTKAKANTYARNLTEDARHSLERLIGRL